MTRKVLTRTVQYALLCFVALIVLFPVLWTLSCALKSPEQQYAWPPTLLPWPVYWQNFTRLFEIMPMGRYLFNSMTVSVGSVLGMCLSSSMAAYAFARMQFKGREFLFFVLLSTMMIPGAITLIPTFVIMSKLKMIDTLWPLIVPNWFGSAFMVFLLRQAYRGIPMSLVESAKLDGATEFQIYSRIFIPLTMPTMVTVALLTFLFSWNDLLGPLIFINNPDLYTVQRGLSLLAGKAGTGIDRRGIIMAGALISMLPMLTMYIFGQRYFIQGLSRSGMKG